VFTQDRRKRLLIVMNRFVFLFFFWCFFGQRRVPAIHNRRRVMARRCAGHPEPRQQAAFGNVDDHALLFCGSTDDQRASGSGTICHRRALELPRSPTGNPRPGTLTFARGRRPWTSSSPAPLPNRTGLDGTGTGQTRQRAPVRDRRIFVARRPKCLHRWGGLKCLHSRGRRGPGCAQFGTAARDVRVEQNKTTIVTL